MIGKMHAYEMMQLESQGVLHLYKDMFAQEEFYQAEHDVVLAITTQISLKYGLKEWGYQAH